MWLVYTLIAAVCLGVGQIFVKKGLHDISPLFNNVLGSIVSVIIMIPFALLMGINSHLVPLAFVYSLLIVSLLAIYYYVVGKGQISLTGTIISTYPLITVVLSFIFLHENPTISQKAAILLTIVGTVLIAMPEKLSQWKIHISGWFGWAIVCAAAAGTADFLTKLTINQSDTYTYLFSYGLAALVIAIVLLLFDKKGRKLPAFKKELYLPTLVGVTIMETGLFFFYLAAGSGLISLVGPVSSIYVAITVVLAYIFLKEKINKIQLVGIISSVAGIILISI
jgi:transporter family protein